MVSDHYTNTNGISRSSVFCLTVINTKNTIEQRKQKIEHKNWRHLLKYPQ